MSSVGSREVVGVVSVRKQVALPLCRMQPACTVPLQDTVDHISQATSVASGKHIREGVQDTARQL